MYDVQHIIYIIYMILLYYKFKVYIIKDYLNPYGNTIKSIAVNTIRKI